ncbi:MAG TPA: hypothetical protein VGS07_05970 [Thermoanaerobaculia bacterium]|jgi:hypothetical protein|nr:hypothetical protein [Thermoanaerobaculia bacterium]
MRTRWILAASILALTLTPGALRAAEEAGCAPAAATAAITNAAAPVSAAAGLPLWSGLPTQNFTPQAAPGNAPKQLFLASCSGCTPTQCARLHSCVLMHCC